MNLRKLVSAGIGVGLLAQMIAPSISTPKVSAAEDIATIAAQDGRFTTLTTALQVSGLADVLRGPGPFTVFAPTDDAFSKLPAGTVASLLNDTGCCGKLQNVLLYHVVPGEVKAADVVKLSSATTAQGSDVKVSVWGGGVRINDARVLITDIVAANGVVHVIDSVLLPPAAAPANVVPQAEDIATIAAQDGRFTTLTTALQVSGLADVLRGPGPFTVFAPTDDAFSKLPAGTVASLLNDTGCCGRLQNVLLYHVVPGEVKAADVVKLSSATTAQGSDVKVSVWGGGVRINDARVLITDIVAANGVVHVIDSVLLPPAR